MNRSEFEIIYNDGRAGLQDENGSLVVPCIYDKILDYDDDGYIRVLKGDIYGTIDLKGNEVIPHSLGITHLGVFHKGTARARKDGMWGLVDVNGKALDGFPYKYMGAHRKYGYDVTTKENEHGIVDEIGQFTPSNSKSKVKNQHSDNVLSICKKIRIDNEGNEITVDGQPIYDYGIIKGNDQYLFPPVYSFLDWNNNKAKNCWYAEDEWASYILFPNGERLIFNKLGSHKYQPYIPKEFFGKHITEAQYHAIKYKPKEVFSQKITRFDKNLFLTCLSNWIEADQGFEFLYRDTDAVVDIKDYYKAGKVIRCGNDMEATQKLLRPVHKIRFIIASRHIPSVKKIKRDKSAGDKHVPFDEYVIGRNVCFMIMDVYRFGSTTQVLLLQLPYTAISIAKDYGLRITPNLLRTKMTGLGDLVENARKELQHKMCEPVHGHSLSENWIQKMYQPIGFDNNLHPIPLTIEDIKSENRNAEHLNSLINYDGFNSKDYFLKKIHDRLTISVGDIMLKFSDSIVIGSADTSIASLKEGECESSFCPGQSYKYKILASYPRWNDEKSHGRRSLASCYRSALKIAEEMKIDNLAFACLGLEKGYPTSLAAKIAINTIATELVRGEFTGSVDICASSNEIADLLIHDWIEVS